MIVSCHILSKSGLGAPQSTEAPDFYDFEEHDTTPFATFIFKYRSLCKLFPPHLIGARLI